MKQFLNIKVPACVINPDRAIDMLGGIDNILLKVIRSLRADLGKILILPIL
jgi:hypothetical protein